MQKKVFKQTNGFFLFGRDTYEDVKKNVSI